MLTFLNADYRNLLISCYHGRTEVNQRTEQKCYVAQRPQHISFLAYAGYYPVLGNRKYNMRIAAAECAWQLMGTQDATFILNNAPKLWSDFVEESFVDGSPYIANAYGYRWRTAFGRDQLGHAIDTLRSNPSDRQCWVSTWDPSSDGCGRKSKNVPCIVGFQLSMQDGRLYMDVVLRSSDVVVGLPYDILVYTMTMYYLAELLDCKPGGMSFTLMNAHYYEAQAKVVEQCLDPYHHWDNNSTERFKYVEKKDLDYQAWVNAHSGMVLNHEYAPEVKVVV